MGSQYPRLFRVVTDKNISISSILGSTRPFSWNFNFRRNLYDPEIEDLEGLMWSLDCLHLSSLVSNARSCSLSSSGLFTINFFFYHCPIFSIHLQFSLLSLYGILKSLLKSSLSSG